MPVFSIAEIENDLMQRSILLLHHLSPTPTNPFARVLFATKNSFDIFPNAGFCWTYLNSPTCQSLEIFVWRSCHRWNEKMINLSKTVILLTRMELRNLAVEYWIFDQLKKIITSLFNNPIHTLCIINLINSINTKFIDDSKYPRIYWP